LASATGHRRGQVFRRNGDRHPHASPDPRSLGRTRDGTAPAASARSSQSAVGVGISEAVAAERTDAARILPAAWPIAEELRDLAWSIEARECGGPDAGWGRHPRLRHMVSPMAAAMAIVAADRVPAVVIRTGAPTSIQRRGQTTDRRGDLSSGRWVGGGAPLRHRPAPIVPMAASPGGWRISCADKLGVGRRDG
jgi:hypothetical protein